MSEPLLQVKNLTKEFDVGAGFLFGNVPIVKQNFPLVTIGIVIVSLLPVAFEWWKRRQALRRPGVAATARPRQPPS